MPTLSAVQKRFLAEATSRYHQSLPGSPAAELLAGRDLTDAGRTFRLGYVADPLPGHESYRGRLAIPYLRWSPSGWSVVSIRFRCAEPGCDCARHAKYLSVPGDPPRLFNTLALVSESDTVAICEGELDAISATVAGVPAVGVAGVESWKPHFRLLFLGYETVFVFADNDTPKFRDDCQRCRGECKGHNPGMDFARHITKELPNAKIVPSELGEDVNSEMVKHGREFIRRKVLM